jgi:MFS family permease
MQSTSRSLSIGVILLLTISCFSLFAGAQSESVQNHPTNDDPYMYIWGSENLDDCWTNFDNLSESSAPEGYGEILFPEGQDVIVDISCELQSGFSENFILEINESISIRMKFNIESGNCGGDECDLTLTLLRGDEQISQFTQPANSVNNGNDYTTGWDIIVDDSIRTWSKDTRTTITVSYAVPAQTNGPCAVPDPLGQVDCSGSFRMYYSDEGGEPGDVYVDFPIYISITDPAANIGKTSLGPIFFIIPFLAVTLLLAWIAYREEWMAGDISEEKESFDINTWRSNTSKKLNPKVWGPLLVSSTAHANKEWRQGGALTENKTRRIVTLCLLYFAQGLPWGFASVTFFAYLTANGTPPGELALLFATIALPWTFKWIWGPVVDAIFIEKYGPRRQWILFAQTGMALSLGSLLLVKGDLNERIGLVTAVLFYHNIFASLQDVATDALAVEILQPDEVAKVNGFMFAAKRGGIIVGGAALGVLISFIGILGVVLAQLVLLLIIIIIPLTLIEKPGVKLFPWSKVDAILVDLDNIEEITTEDIDKPWIDEVDFIVARNVGYSVSEERIPFSAFFAIIGVSIWFTGFAVDIFTINWWAGDLLTESITSPISNTMFLLAILFFLIQFVMRKSDNDLPPIINPFILLPTSSRNTVARTSFYLVKAFSVRSALLLIGLCLLSELYLFVAPITVDIFINEAGWSQSKYNGIIGGLVVFVGMFGQVFGGFMGDRYGTRRVAMVGFLCLGLANATLAFLEPLWTNTTVMICFLCIQAFIASIAWICIISLSMRLTWSKVGGTQFTAYMSFFNLSAVYAYTLTGKLISIFDYSSAIYFGAALTMITVIMLIFIDENETDRVLEGRIQDDEEWEEEDPDTDLGERPEWWDSEDLEPSTS